MRLRRVAGMACQELVELVTDYLEGALPARDRRRLEAHIALCPHCREYLAEMRRTLELTGRLRAEDFTPEMREDFREVYRRYRDEER